MTGYSLGNGKSSVNTFVNGFPTQFQTSGIQSLNMVWDYQKGNLTSRNDARSGVSKTESFTYDNLNRLTGSQISGVTGTFGVTYATNGNISSKTDAGVYTYDASKIHAVTNVTNPVPSPIPSFQQDITYTAFNQPGVVSENGNQLTYTYGADYERIKGVLMSGSTTVHTRFYFAGGFEKDVTAAGTRYIQYITSPVGLIAIVVSNGSSHDVHYTYTDHLGSIVTVTDAAGNPEAQQSFDAWGRRRDYQSWVLLAPTATVPGIPDWLYRGYTGHEHLDRFGLINMNGRLYDPVLGRVLSPDNYIQDPFGTQDYNRYSYARNNPLLYNDPDGNNPLIGALIGAFSYTLGVAFSDGGFRNWNWFGFASTVLIGAVTAGIGADIAAATAQLGTVGSGFVSGAASGFLGGGLGAAFTGGDILKGAIGGAIWGGAIGAATGALDAVLSKHAEVADPNTSFPEGNPVEPTNEALSAFSEKYFPGAQKEFGFNFKVATAKSLPDGYKFDKAFNLLFDPADGTHANGVFIKALFKKPTLWISQGAMVSDQQLFRTLGHELIHSWHDSFTSYIERRLDNYLARTESVAHNWSLVQGARFGAKIDSSIGQLSTFFSQLTPSNIQWYYKYHWTNNTMFNIYR